MSHESLGNEPEASESAAAEVYQGAFGPTELSQFPGEFGEIRLAETYSEPGTQVTWESYSPTASNSPEADAPRQALITDTSNNIYYLRGNTLFDIGASAKEGTPVGTSFNEDSPLPDLTVGEPVDLIDREVTVKQITIATESVEADDPIVEHATLRQENPFQAMKESLDSLRESVKQRKAAQAAEEKRLREEADLRSLQREKLVQEAREAARRANYQPTQPITAGGTFVTGEYHRRWDYSHPHPKRPTSTTNHRPGSRLGAVDERVGPKSLYGVENSPRAGVPPLAFKEEDFRRTEALYNANLKYGKEVAERAVQSYIRDKEDEAVERGKKARRQEYQPRMFERDEPRKYHAHTHVPGHAHKPSKLAKLSQMLKQKLRRSGR